MCNRRGSSSVNLNVTRVTILVRHVLPIADFPKLSAKSCQRSSPVHFAEGVIVKLKLALYPNIPLYTPNFSADLSTFLLRRHYGQPLFWAALFLLFSTFTWAAPVSYTIIPTVKVSVSRLRGQRGVCVRF